MSRREDLERTLRALVGALDDNGNASRMKNGPTIEHALKDARRVLDPSPSEYPEHDKLQRVSDRTQAVGDFLEWAGADRGLHLCAWSDDADQYLPARWDREELLGAWVDVDPNKIELEKRAMLNKLREMNGQPS